MDVEYQLNQDDWIAFYGYAHRKAILGARHSWFTLQVAVGGLCLVAALASVVVVYEFLNLHTSMSWPERSTILFPIVALPFLMLLIIGVSKLPGQLRQKVKKGVKAGTIKLHLTYRLSLTPAGLTEVAESHKSREGFSYSERTETRVQWSSVVSIDVVGPHAFIAVGPEGYFIVPKQAFPDDFDFLEFVRVVKAREYSGTEPDERWRLRQEDERIQAKSPQDRITQNRPDSV